jgi:predicted nucleic acid-binding protein
MSLESCYKDFSDTDAVFPPYIFFDTSFVVEALVFGQPNHDRAKAFIERLANAIPQPVVTFSDLLYTELRCAILSLVVQNSLGVDRRGAIKAIKKNPELIKKHFCDVEKAEKNFREILQRFEHRLDIPMTEDITERAGVLMPKYRLGSNDAIHVASMEDMGINDIAVIDRDLIFLPRYKGRDIVVWTVDGFEKYKKQYLTQEPHRKNKK